MAAEIPRTRAYSRAVVPLRFQLATSSAHSAALRRGAFSSWPRTRAVVFLMPSDWGQLQDRAPMQRVRGLRRERVKHDFALLAASINLARLAALGVRIAPIEMTT
ncbi:MAG: hypothetical protein M3470_10280 [Chloroflexota bacterium]|nr:hypothetical protein [Chloroflexota bacterium]